jgi:predicted site-specific integrase-resolvase
MELTSLEAAEIIGVSYVTVRRYMKRGLLKGRMMGIRQIARIKPDDLRDFAIQNGYIFDEDKLRSIEAEKQ